MLSSRTNIFVGRIGKLKKGFVESGGGQKPDQPSNPHGVRTEVDQVIHSWHRLLRFTLPRTFPIPFYADLCSKIRRSSYNFVSDADIMAEDTLRIYRNASLVKMPKQLKPIYLRILNIGHEL